jgi:CubicO group peptidase (beta-lactamase class C family)
VAHHYSDGLDWTTISPTIDWAGGGLVTTAPDLARFVRALWSGAIVDSRALHELARWTPGVSFLPGHALRYERYGLAIGANVVEGVELVGHTGFVRAFAFHAPEYDAVLVGTHNASQVDRWPLVAALLPGVAGSGLIDANPADLLEHRERPRAGESRTGRGSRRSTARCRAGVQAGSKVNGNRRRPTGGRAPSLQAGVACSSQQPPVAGSGI